MIYQLYEIPLLSSVMWQVSWVMQIWKLSQRLCVQRSCQTRGRLSNLLDNQRLYRTVRAHVFPPMTLSNGLIDLCGCAITLAEEVLQLAVQKKLEAFC